jgi:outer membrane protein assembly factor BamB
MLIHRIARRHPLCSVMTAGMVIGLVFSACQSPSISPGSTSISSPTAHASASYLYEATVSPTGRNAISALNPQTDEQVWQAQVTGIPAVAVASGNTFVVSSTAYTPDPSQFVDHVSGLDIQTGKQLWQRDTKSLGYASLFASQGKLYGVLMPFGRTRPDSISLVNINPANGSLIWQKRLAAPGTPRTAISAGDMLYVVSADSARQYLTTFHLTDGSMGERVDIPVNLNAASGPTPRYANGTVYYDLQYAPEQTRIIALHANDATPLWEKTFDRSATVLTASNNAVLVTVAPDPASNQGDPQGSLLALNPTDGTPLWQAQRYSLDFGEVAMEAEQIVVFTHPEGSDTSPPSVRALNARTGAVLWSDTLAPSQQQASIHVLDGIVYVELTPVGDATSQSDRLLAIRESDGILVWKSYRALTVLADGVFQ